MIEEGLEISTGVGCSVNCRKYCAQEVIVPRYEEVSNHGTRSLKLDDFKKYISTVPKNVLIQFSGVCEPFLNPQCINMIEYACEQGYRVRLYTTLVGCNKITMGRLIRLPLDYVLLHLPDACGVANIPITDEYKDVLTMALTNLPMAGLVSMNPSFTTNHREDKLRGLVKKRKWYPITCNALYVPQRVMLPNGQVYLCCCDHRFEGFMGDLKSQSYAELKKPRAIESCRYCGLAMFPPLYYARNWAVSKWMEFVWGKIV